MPYEQRDNSGSVFVNDRKEKDTHPDRTGTAMIDGRMYWISGWLKESADGKKFMSLAFKPKEEARQSISQRATPSHPAPRRSMKEDMDDEIPF